MRRVAVTGADTPLGRRLVRALVDGGVAERVLAATSRDTPPGPGARSAPITTVAADLARVRGVEGLLFGPMRTEGIDTLVHTTLALEGRGPGRRVHPVSVEATRALLDFAEHHPTLRRFVFLSWADVYRVEPDQPVLVEETHPLELSAMAPRRVRERVEADVTVSTRGGRGRLEVVVLRCAEILAPAVGSQLWDYLRSRICFRPFGFDPMLNLASVEDAVRALCLAAASDAAGIFNVPGFDTLPLSRLIEAVGRVSLPVPGLALAPLYDLRSTTLGMGFRYDANYRRFHFSAVLDGRRAEAELGYVPQVPVRFVVPPLSRRAWLGRWAPRWLRPPAGSPRAPG